MKSPHVFSESVWKRCNHYFWILLLPLMVFNVIYSMINLGFCFLTLLSVYALMLNLYHLIFKMLYLEMDEDAFVLKNRLFPFISFKFAYTDIREVILMEAFFYKTLRMTICMSNGNNRNMWPTLVPLSKFEEIVQFFQSKGIDAQIMNYRDAQRSF